MAILTQTASKATATVTAATVNTVSASGIDAWTGFHVAIVSGTGAGQLRYAPTSPGTNQLDVVPDWDVTPSTDSVIHQAKNQDDYVTDYGNSFKLLLKSTEEWDANARDGYAVGNGTDPAVFGMYGQGISLDDHIEVANNGYLALGALFGDTTLGGWYFNSNNAESTLGFAHLQILSGGTAFIGNTNFGTVYAHTVEFQSGSTGYLYDVSFSNVMYNGADLLGDIYGRNVKYQGKGVTNDYVNVNTGINTFEGPLILSNCYGLVPVGSSQTIVINKYISAVPSRDLEALGSNIFEFNSPTWGDSSGAPLVLWTDNTGNSGWDELFDLAVTIKAGETAIENARFTIVEGTTTKTLVNSNNSDASGIVSDKILKRRARTSAAITTYQPNIARCWKYEYAPFQANIDPTTDVVLPIPLNDDTTLTVTEATALAYTGITFTEATTNKNTAIAYDGGTVAIAVNDVVTQTPSGASGTVKEVVGDTTSGTIFLISRNSTAFVDNQVLQVSAATVATADTATFNKDFTWAIDGGANSLQAINDYHMAKLAMAVPDSWVTELRERGLRAIDKSGDNFFTNNESSEGAWIYNRGGGTLSYFTADDGIQWFPPTSVTLTVTASDINTGSPIAGASVYGILIAGDGSLVVMNGVTDATGLFTTNYTGTVPVTLDSAVSAVRSGSGTIPYQEYVLGGQITSSGYSATALMSED